MLSRLEGLKKDIEETQEQTQELERNRDQYIIHLLQCQEDNNILTNIYKKLKLKYDIETYSEKNPEQPLQSTEPITMKSVEVIEIEPQIATNSDTPSNLVLNLRYAMNTSSIICTAQFSHNGKCIAFAGPHFIYMLNADDGELLYTIELPQIPNHSESDHTKCIKFSPDDRYLAATRSETSIILYEVNLNSPIQNHNEKKPIVHIFGEGGHEKGVNSIVFSKDGKRMITAGYDGILVVWDMTTFEIIKRINHQELELPDPMIIGLSTSVDNSIYALGFVAGILGIYDEHISQSMVQFPTDQKQIMGISISQNDHSYIATSSTTNVKIWEVKLIAQLKKELVGHTDFVLASEFSINHPLIFTGSKDKTIKIWDIRTGKLLMDVLAHNNTVFQISHDPTKSSFVSCSGDGIVCVWDYGY